MKHLLLNVNVKVLNKDEIFQLYKTYLGNSNWHTCLAFLMRKNNLIQLGMLHSNQKFFSNSFRFKKCWRVLRYLSIVQDLRLFNPSYTMFVSLATCKTNNFCPISRCGNGKRGKVWWCKVSFFPISNVVVVVHFSQWSCCLCSFCNGLIIHKESRDDTNNNGSGYFILSFNT